jgi:hypothetical protein
LKTSQNSSVDAEKGIDGNQGDAKKGHGVVAQVSDISPTDDVPLTDLPHVKLQQQMQAHPPAEGNSTNMNNHQQQQQQHHHHNYRVRKLQSTANATTDSPTDDVPLTDLPEVKKWNVEDEDNADGVYHHKEDEDDDMPLSEYSGGERSRREYKSQKF